MQRRILQLEMSSKQADNFAADIPILRNESVPNLRVNQSNTDNILSQRNVFSDNNIRRAVVPNLSSKLNDVKEVSPNLWKLKIIDKLEMYANNFLSDRHQKNYLIDQTEGIARKYLEPLILNKDLD
ncbi:putative simnilar to protein from sclerotinia sclerotiorum [Erysiphe necator]|uniref:Putative simnilar to protein from sclerotinia sclerotiorum n=1 Tax=Uncinula necator TaxID=52586 RepID=A0A0B1P992_UNCNE|nr:putative simnilar to protein from sclerotinia sclerotiorum [Erysiphe necator]